MRSILLSLLPSLAFVFFVFISVQGLLLWGKFKKRGRRNPLTSQLLRAPGQSIQGQLQDITGDIAVNLLMLPTIPIALYAVYLTQVHYSGVKESLAVWLFLGFLTFVICIYLFVKTAKLTTQRNNLRLGLDGELAVGQELNHLMLEGFRVYHDFPAEKFNIDHIAVGPTGVFAVETKGRAKPDKGRGNIDAKVFYDGEALKFPDWHEKKPLDQTKRQAVWLNKWLSSAVGEQIPVRPVLALPGWFVENTKRGDVLVFSGKSPQFLSKLKVAQGLSESMIQRISHQLEQRCRDVEPSSYQK